MNYTKGPWERYDDNTVQLKGASGGKGDCVAVVYGVGNGYEECNAALIAAAPQLYEACREALKVISCTENEVINKLEEAINKAKGAL